jgi:molybdenum cofactor cytidylyltransferase
MRLAAVVLAAGASTRFGSPKAIAQLDGRPILEHVLDAIREVGIDDIVVVLGNDAEQIEEGIAWLDERLVRNPDPREMSSSLQIGIDALAASDPAPQAVLVALGDQPRTRPAVLRALAAAARSSELPIVVPRYAEGGGSNPVLLRREAFDIVDEATGDRGLGPLIDTRPELVLQVDVPGRNPDVDTPADLDALQTRTHA